MIITIILTCGFRIGNKKYERDNNSFGITTLKFSHVNIIDKYIEIDFIVTHPYWVYSIDKKNNKLLLNKELNEKVEKLICSSFHRTKK